MPDIRIRELSIPTGEQIAEAWDILKYFKFEHLPPNLRAVSEPWCHLAEHIVATAPRCAERSVALRKLLEGKDAAVRACLP